MIATPLHHKLHIFLKKERLGLSALKARVPAVTSLAYDGGWDSQKAKLIIRLCRLRLSRWCMPEEAVTMDYSTYSTLITLSECWLPLD